MAKEFLPAMLSRNEGHIVSIASLGGLFASDQSEGCFGNFGIDNMKRTRDFCRFKTVLKSINVKGARHLPRYGHPSQFSVQFVKINALSQRFREFEEKRR